MTRTGRSENGEHRNNNESFNLDVYRYDQMDTSKVESITQAATERSDQLLEEIVGAEELTYNNVMVKLDRVEDALLLAEGKAAFMGYVHPDSEVRDAGSEAEERLMKYRSDLKFNEDLYKVVKAFSETDEALDLSEERLKYLEDTLTAFEDAGYHLDSEAREKLRELNGEIIRLSTEFQKNLNNDETTVSFTPDDLDGLPDDFKERLSKDDDGNLIVTMAYPDVQPILKNAHNRNTRKATYMAFRSRCKEENMPILQEIIDKRAEVSAVLGKPSWAHHRMRNQMAENPENVMAFYDSIVPALSEKSAEEVARMQELLHEDGYDDQLRGYDTGYYENQLLKTEYGVDHEKISEYFELNNVIDGMFEITGTTFGLKFEKLDAPSYHPDVHTYAIFDAATGKQISKFHMDLFPRKGKYGHAAAFNLKPGCELPDGEYRKPESAIVANFTPPTKDKPSLLKHSEVETTFHEFGHIIHQTLTRTETSHFAGTSVEDDFVEAPSQIMEHWTWAPEVLAKFAKHYKTGEPMPTELIEKMASAKNLNIGTNQLGQVCLGLLDLAMHDASELKNIAEIDRKVDELRHTPREEGVALPASFGHLVGGYDAAYYGYLWSEVYGDAMFEKFKEEGLTNPEVGLRYRHEILERGGSRKAMDSIKAFLGKAPTSEAFLKNMGIES